MRSSFIAIAAALGTTSTASFAATDNIWDLLDQIEIDEVITADSYSVRKSFPAGISEADQEIEITGYAAPMLPGDLVQELILVSDMGLCPLCGDPDHGLVFRCRLPRLSRR